MSAIPSDSSAGGARPGVPPKRAYSVGREKLIMFARNPLGMLGLLLVTPWYEISV